MIELIIHKTILGKFLVMVLKNRGNEIRSNEIRRELPVYLGAHKNHAGAKISCI